MRRRFRFVIALALLIACGSDTADPGDNRDASERSVDEPAGDGLGGPAAGDGSVPDATADPADPAGAAGPEAGVGEGSISDAAPTDGSTDGAEPSSEGSGALTLDQIGNPIYEKLKPYISLLSTAADAAAKLAADKALADNIITWQMPHGGFYKNAKAVYAAAWNGNDARSDWRGEDDVELGTIDNTATVSELLFLADVYQRSGVVKYRDSARRAADFLLRMQYPSGGFPQVYPARVGTTYSNYVTFNDDAMARVLVLFDQAVKRKPPLDKDVFTTEQLERMASAIIKGVDYILKAQIVQDGVKTVWCAQHDPESYAAKPGRSYELASKSGKESAAIVAFLLTQPQTPAIKAAVQAAIAWYKSNSVKVVDKAYVKRPSDNSDDGYNPIQASPGRTMWYRFYDLDQDRGFFCGRQPSDDPPGAGKKYDIMEIEPERRYGYEWGGSYGSSLFTYTDKIGY
jgi:PelA/Pel-15E family pectate lyase